MFPNAPPNAAPFHEAGGVPRLPACRRLLAGVTWLVRRPYYPAQSGITAAANRMPTLHFCLASTLQNSSSAPDLKIHLHVLLCLSSLLKQIFDCRLLASRHCEATPNLPARCFADVVDSYPCSFGCRDLSQRPQKQAADGRTGSDLGQPASGSVFGYSDGEDSDGEDGLDFFGEALPWPDRTAAAAVLLAAAAAAAVTAAGVGLWLRCHRHGSKRWAAFTSGLRSVSYLCSHQKRGLWESGIWGSRSPPVALLVCTRRFRARPSWQSAFTERPVASCTPSAAWIVCFAYTAV